MCGILGYYGDKSAEFHNGNPLKTIYHRGPDYANEIFGEGYYLGHTRLSILDLSERGNQPMFSENDRYALIFNGELYNHLELREKYLKEIDFMSSNDTETLLYGLIKFGENFVDNLNGIFAFSFYDFQTSDYIIARDHFGVKPLYYARNEEGISFSSEIKALIPFLKTKTIHLGALKNYINFLWSPEELTPLKEIKKLLPGHLITGNSKSLKSIEIKQYYQLHFKPIKNPQITEKELVDLLDEKLTKAVERQLLSDVPLGFFLSGGLDSSILVAIAKKITGNKKLECYTINAEDNLSDEGFTGDLHYAKLVAEYLDVNLTIVDAKTDILKEFDKVVYHLDEPQADPAPINVLNICKEAKKNGLKVLIGGTAGDDLFSGYRRHQALSLELMIEKTPLFLRKFLKSVLSNFSSKKALIRRLKKLSANIEKNKETRMMGYFDWIAEKDLNELFKNTNNFDNHSYFKTLSKKQRSDIDDLNKMLFWELNTFLVDHNLNYTDKLSMATGIEVRVPFLDKELVEFSTQIPTHFKLKGKETKYILKMLGERYLPKEVIYRPKTGFGAPIRKWITDDMNDMIENYLSKNQIESRGIFNYDKVKNIIETNKKGETDFSYPIWSLLAI